MRALDEICDPMIKAKAVAPAPQQFVRQWGRPWSLLDPPPAQTAKPVAPAPEQPNRQWGRPWSLLDPPTAQTTQERLQKSTALTPTPVPSIASESSNLCETPVGPLGNYLPRKIDYSKLSGCQMVALRVGLDPATQGLESMSVEQMKDLVRKKTEDIVRPQRRALGIPEPVQRPRNYVIPSY